jgi:hypothetical protein
VLEEVFFLLDHLRAQLIVSRMPGDNGVVVLKSCGVQRFENGCGSAMLKLDGGRLSSPGIHEALLMLNVQDL